MDRCETLIISATLNIWKLTWKFSNNEGNETWLVIKKVKEKNSEAESSSDQSVFSCSQNKQLENYCLRGNRTDGSVCVCHGEFLCRVCCSTGGTLHKHTSEMFKCCSCFKQKPFEPRLSLKLWHIWCYFWENAFLLSSEQNAQLQEQKQTRLHRKHRHRLSQ